jgi:ZIP family zinc transporter
MAGTRRTVACCAVLTVIAVGALTALATGLGAIPVFYLGRRAAVWEPALWGLAAGSLAVASVVGLLLPAADEGSTADVLGGFLAGVAFLAVTRLVLRTHEVQIGELSGAGVSTSVLVFIVLSVHSLPEGFAIGTAYASDTAGLGLFVILAIGLQNVPEGTSVAIPMNEAGFSRSQQFWAAVLTSAPQPLGAAIAYALVETVESLLSISFAFAGGAMLALVVTDLLPRSLSPPGWRGPLGIAAGALVMLALSAALGV